MLYVRFASHILVSVVVHVARSYWNPQRVLGDRHESCAKYFYSFRFDHIFRMSSLSSCSGSRLVFMYLNVGVLGVGRGCLGCRISPAPGGIGTFGGRVSPFFHPSERSRRSGAHFVVPQHERGGVGEVEAKASSSRATPFFLIQKSPRASFVFWS